MNYKSAISFLWNKYGKVQYDYFCNENKKIQRSCEGLFLHHIDEDKYINLSQREVAKIYPYEAQKADRLVYCNYLEHLILHIRFLNNFYMKGGDVMVQKEYFYI